MSKDSRYQANLTPFSTHWGTYYAEVKDGRLKAIHDYQGDSDPSDIGPGIVDAIYHPTRITEPAIRKGFLKDRSRSDRSGRGREPFVAVPWDEALDIAASELERLRRDHGNSAIFGGSYGWASAGRFHHAQSQVHRFLNCIGGYTASIDTYSYAAVSALMPHVVGHFSNLILDRATSWKVIARHTELMVMFGGLAIKNTQVNAGGVGDHSTRAWLRAAADNGCKFVNISPLRSDAVPEIDAEWVAIRPNTDTALMLALAHELVSQGLHDRSFLERYCAGFDRFLPYLMGRTDGTPKDALWASKICGVPADSIERLARLMATKRTMMSVAWSVQRADHGEQPCWMAIVLAAMLGQIGLPGGGFGIGYGCASGVGNPVSLMKYPALPQGRNAVQAPIPVARIADALLNPGQSYDFNGKRSTYPDLRLIYWAGGNPFHHHQDLNRLIGALQRPETIIVNEIWWTGLARYADIVFPVTTAVEREDISLVGWDPLVVAMRQAIPPVGQSRHDYEIFSELAHRMGVGDAFTEGRSSEDWLLYLWKRARQKSKEAGFDLPDLATLRAAGVISRPPASEDTILLEAFRNDPDGERLATPSGRIEIFSQRIASFGYEDCPGHPMWLEPYEWLGADLAKRFPLHLISNQPRTRLHSQLDPGAVSQASKIQGREPMMMSPLDAASRGLKSGDVARVFNDRGCCLAGVVVSDNAMPGVVQLATGAWFDPADPHTIGSLCKHGNVNILTHDKGSSRLGQGPSAQTALVQVEKCEGDLPPVTAFIPPMIERRE